MDAHSDQAQRARVLAVDDDPAILDMLSRILAGEGFDVIAVSTAEAAIQQVHGDPPDVVLLDVMLADRDGFEVLAELRRTQEVPIILLTGRGDEPDRVLGLRMGADDYVVKPFSYAELIARIQTILRRTAPRTASSVRTFGPMSIDLASRQVTLDGSVVETTAKEFDLLAFLSGSPRQVFTRHQLLEQVWESSSEWQDQATVTEHVRRLRLRIEADPANPRWIVTVRGVGYRFEP